MVMFMVRQRFPRLKVFLLLFLHLDVFRRPLPVNLARAGFEAIGNLFRQQFSADSRSQRCLLRVVSSLLPLNSMRTVAFAGCGVLSMIRVLPLALRPLLSGQANSHPSDIRNR